MVKNELTKIYTNVVVYIAIIATAIIFMSGTLYRSLEDGKEYNLFNIAGQNLKDGSEGEIVPDFSQGVIEGPASYMNLFSVIIVSIPFTMLVSAERKNSNTRFEIMRVGKIRYALGKFAAVIISGGSVMLLGYGIYCIACYFILSHNAGEIYPFRYTINNRVSIYIFEKTGIAGMYILKMLFMFCYGMASTIMAYLLSAFMKNRYLILCLPFVINYLYVTYTDTIVDTYIPQFQDIQAAYRYENRDVIKLSAVFVFSLIMAFVVYIVLMDRKCDCGE